MVLLRIIAVDNIVFEVESNVFQCSTTINAIERKCEGLSLFEDDDVMRPPIELHLPTVRPAILFKIAEWSCYHGDDVPTVVVDDDDDHDDDRDEECKEEKGVIDDIPAWDREFLNVDRRQLFEIISAAHQLEIKLLAEYACKIVGQMIHSKTPTEIFSPFDNRNEIAASQSFYQESNIVEYTRPYFD